MLEAIKEVDGSWNIDNYHTNMNKAVADVTGELNEIQKQRDIFKYLQIMWHLLRDYKFQQPEYFACFILYFSYMR